MGRVDGRLLAAIDRLKSVCKYMHDSNTDAVLDYLSIDYLSIDYLSIDYL